MTELDHPRARTRGRRLAGLTGAARAPLLVLTALPTAQAAATGGVVSLEVLGNRADLVSGGDALVRVVLPAALDPRQLRLEVDGRDVSSSFALRPNGQVEGLLTG